MTLLQQGRAYTRELIKARRATRRHRLHHTCLRRTSPIDGDTNRSAGTRVVVRTQHIYRSYMQIPRTNTKFTSVTEGNGPQSDGDGSRPTPPSPARASRARPSNPFAAPGVASTIGTLSSAARPVTTPLHPAPQNSHQVLAHPRARAHVLIPKQSRCHQRPPHDPSPELLYPHASPRYPTPPPMPPNYRQHHRGGWRERSKPTKGSRARKFNRATCAAP